MPLDQRARPREPAPKGPLPPRRRSGPPAGDDAWGFPAPWRSENAASDALLLPVRAYKWLIYDARPNVVTRKMRDADWRRLRSPWRWANGMVCYLGPPGSILWNIKWPLLLNLAVAGAIVADALASGTRLVASVFTIWRLSLFILALLMSAKVNRAYDRWWAARAAFAGVGTAAITVAHQAAVWVADPRLRSELVRWAKVWPYSIAHLLLGHQDLPSPAAELLTRDEALLYARAPKGRQLVVLRLRQLAAAAGLDAARFLQLDGAITRGVAESGAAVRIKLQCMPYALTLSCTGFLEIWLLLMPFALVSDNPTGPTAGNVAFGLVCYTLVCILLLGVDEAASYLENPYPSLPIEEMAASNLRDISRVLDEAAALEAAGAALLDPGRTWPPPASSAVANGDLDSISGVEGGGLPVSLQATA